MYDVMWMPWLAANAATLRFCRNGLQLDLVGRDVFRSDGGDGSLHQADREVRHADLLREALRLRLGERVHEFGDRHASPGDGQWISVRSTLSVRSLREAFFQARNRLARATGSPSRSWW